jgi:predicted nucleic acid-binding protein
MSKFTVVYDACVLYPAPLRDTLMWLGMSDLFKAHWTDHIHEEWIRALMRTGKYELTKLERARDLMDAHCRDAKVTGYESLIETLVLPDPNDRHVLAAAIRCGADAIVTKNFKDFPESVISAFGIDVLHPDDFLYYQIDLAPAICCKYLRQQRIALKNPAMEIEEFLSVLQKQQLPQTVSRLRDFVDFL